MKKDFIKIIAVVGLFLITNFIKQNTFGHVGNKPKKVVVDPGNPFNTNLNHSEIIDTLR